MGNIGISQLLILFVPLLVPIVLAFYFNNKFQDRDPNSRPYRWGFFIAIQIGAVYPLLTLINLSSSSYGNGPSDISYLNLSLILISTIIMVICGFYTFKRYKWPWILILIIYGTATLYTFITGQIVISVIQVVILVLNLFYVMNRWDEFHPSKQNDDPSFP